MPQDSTWDDFAALGRDKRGIAHAIAGAIRDGRLPGGQRLPTERHLAESCRLSRNTVREALARLADQGLITRHVGRGTFVADDGQARAAQAGSEPVLAAIAAPRELVEFRAECEPALASLIVMNASDEELRELEAFMLQGRQTTTWEDCEHIDAEFHARLFAATRNVVFMQIGNYLRRARAGQAWRSLKQNTFALERWQAYQAEHERIMEHLLRRDAEAARVAIRAHFSRVQGWVS
jgi:DNA-binding FadR family transcriptional regulator